jgi:hypothetical protein
VDLSYFPPKAFHLYSATVTYSRTTRTPLVCRANGSFLLPNVISAALLAIDFFFLLFFLKESHERGTGRRIENATHRLWDAILRFWRFAIGHQNPTSSAEQEPERRRLLRNRSSLASVKDLPLKTLLTKNIFLIVGTFALFSLCIVAYNQLFPLFLSSPRPAGREMEPNEIGYALSGAALASIVMQALLFTTIERIFGFTWCYRLGLFVFTIAFFLTPLIGLWGGHVGMWIQIVIVLVLKTLANVLGLTCAMLLVYLLISS